MKTLLKLPISFVKVIIALAMLSIGIIILLSVIIVYFDYKALFTKKKEKTDEA
jgi:Tfp pilus assembly protein PilW